MFQDLQNASSSASPVISSSLSLHDDSSPKTTNGTNGTTNERNGTPKLPQDAVSNNGSSKTEAAVKVNEEKTSKSDECAMKNRTEESEEDVDDPQINVECETKEELTPADLSVKQNVK